jgi:hypothetical protein
VVVLTASGEAKVLRAQLGKLGDDLFWLGQNRDGIRLKAGAGSVAGFELATEDEGGEGEFLFWQAERGA